MPAPLVVSDMDGTLATVDTWRGVHDWIRARYPSRDADRFVRVRMPSIVMARVFGRDKEGFRARWQEDQARLLQGMDAGLLDELAVAVVEEHLWPSRRQVAVDAVHAAIDAARATDAGARLVLVLRPDPEDQPQRGVELVVPFVRGDRLQGLRGLA